METAICAALKTEDTVALAMVEVGRFSNMTAIISRIGPTSPTCHPMLQSTYLHRQ